MTVEISVPSVGESITEVTIETWLVAVGDTVQADQPIAEVSSDKADLELPAPVSGTITEILVADGDDVQVGQVIGRMEAGDVQVASSAPLVEAPPKVEEPKPATPPCTCPTNGTPCPHRLPKPPLPPRPPGSCPLQNEYSTKADCRSAQRPDRGQGDVFSKRMQ